MSPLDSHRYAQVDTSLAAAVHWTDASVRPPYLSVEAPPPNAWKSMETGKQL